MKDKYTKVLESMGTVWVPFEEARDAINQALTALEEDVSKHQIHKWDMSEEGDYDNGYYDGIEYCVNAIRKAKEGE